MNNNERSKLPPPERCKKCVFVEEWTLEGKKRWLCRKGHPMHPNCGWHREPGQIRSKYL